ncbi:tetraacyldisaccharide 4'-kinase [uncultured Bacteroides sp.]|uniref:tetraacyldisaccharide 4'-kinase n=1 Tax=uncultured Bacteroides sp. TaxID=162156 RepID=UPI002AA6A279|nr:tetraacyldisaccharide 4'-kinase [uncultured Bacteroides sp.]
MEESRIRINKWLCPVSLIYGVAISIRNRLFDWGLLRSKSFDIPTICIGNLSVGGTGKTPHTEYLIKLLQSEFHIAVLSRGYKRHTRGYRLASADSIAHTIGDEPYQIKTKFPNIRVAVDENRCHGIEQLGKLSDSRIDIILLDDAFQHRYVKAGINILLTDYHRLFCEDQLLPAGRLRESVSGKNRAQMVIVTKCPADIKPIDFNIISKQLNLYPYQQLYFSTFKYGKLTPLFPESGEKRRDLSSLQTDEHVLLLTGIASPTTIVEELQNRTTHIDLLTFDDHHDFSSKDMQMIKERFDHLKGEKKIIITTEKDAARLIHHPALNNELKAYLYTLPIEVKILQNQQHIFNQNIIGYVRENKRNNILPERKDAYQS